MQNRCDIVVARAISLLTSLLQEHSCWFLCNKISLYSCCVIQWCTAPCSVPSLLSCCLSLVALHPSRHAIPLLLRFASLLSCRLSPSSPLSSLVASLVAPHHSPLFQEQGWLLCNKTVHSRLTTSLGAPTAKNGGPPPHHLHRCLSCHAALRRTLQVTP